MHFNFNNDKSDLFINFDHVATVEPFYDTNEKDVWELTFNNNKKRIVRCPRERLVAILSGKNGQEGMITNDN